VEEFADSEFGFGVFAAHPAHVVAALRGRVYVGHEVRNVEVRKGNRYQMTSIRSRYKLNFSSAEMMGIFSARAVASSSRSKGSR